MPDAYKVKDIPGRVPNEAVFLDREKALQHVTKFGGQLVELVEKTQPEKPTNLEPSGVV